MLKPKPHVSPALMAIYVYELMYKLNNLHRAWDKERGKFTISHCDMKEVIREYDKLLLEPRRNEQY